MDDDASDEKPEGLTSRAPESRDLVELCRELNRLEAKYVVVGGLAIVQAGYPRTTGDVDLLVDASLENEAIVFKALESLPDQAVKELDPGDVAKFLVVRVADEILVDLMAKASGIDYAEAAKSVVVHELDGVSIPFASPELLWRMKIHTHREKDAPDLFFLRKLFEAQGRTPPE
ncbi:MAG: hypothetical protein ACOYMS_05255 [Terrimicrobiaceae bacterium]